MNPVSVRFRRLCLALATIPALLIGTAGCERTNSTPSTSCATGLAQIAIGDGFQEILCGCQETAGTILIAGGTALSCTVSSGTTILFQHIDGRQTRQIVSTTAGTFSDSPVYDPGAPIPIRAFQLQFTTPGTYGYQDRFNTNLAGSITVI